MLPRWSDLRKVLALKTFYIALLLVVCSLALFAAWTGFDRKESAWAQTVLALAIALATSSTISLVSELALRLDIVRLVITELSSSLSQRDQSTVVEFHESRRNLDCVSLAHGATGTLRIIGISANDILAVQPLDIIARRVRMGELRLQVILLDPESAAGRARAGGDAYSSKGSMASRVQGIVHHLIELATELRSTATGTDQLDARYTGTFPMLSAIIDDSKAIVTPLVSHLTGGRSPYFVVAADGPQGHLYRTYRRHFEASWKEARSFL